MKRIRVRGQARRRKCGLKVVGAGEKGSGVGVKCVRVRGQARGRKWREGGSVAGEKAGERAGR